MTKREDLTFERRRRLRGEGRPIVIDGGMGTELERRGARMDGAVWSGVAILEQPSLVREIHEDFIAAGAEVIITNTFSSGRHMLEPAGYGDRLEDINRDAVALARAAIKRTGATNVTVAGSICEWATDTDSPWSRPEMIGTSVAEQAKVLADAGVDLLVLEMCERPQYSVPAVQAAMETGLPVWVGVSCQSRRDVDMLPVFDYPDVSFEHLIGALATLEPEVMNIMHSPVPDVPIALDLLRTVWDGPVGVYPESGYFIKPHWQFVDVISPEELAHAAESWLARGVRLLGGCCGLGPNHVRALAAVADEAG